MLLSSYLTTALSSRKLVRRSKDSNRPLWGRFCSELTAEQEVIKEGADTVILLQCNSDHSKPQVRSALKAERVTEWLECFQVKLTQRDEQKAERIATNLLKQQEREEAQLEKTSNNSPEGSKGKADKALGKARGEEQDSGNGNSGGSGNSGNGNSGGGGGNSGGGGGNPNK